MFVLFKTENKEGIDKFIEFLIKHQSDPIYKGECVENLFINSELTRIQWDKEITTCYDVYTSKEFQLIVFETIDIVFIKITNTFQMDFHISIQFLHILQY